MLEKRMSTDERRPELAPYSIRWTREAREAKRQLPAEVRIVVSDLEADLSWDPNCFETRPSDTKGSSRNYFHPDPPILITFEPDHEKKCLVFLDYHAFAFSLPDTIFISYSHEDREWLDKLKAFLQDLEEQGHIRFVDDHELEAGRPYEEQIRELIREARAGLMLISQNFLKSQFIGTEELPQILTEARERGKRVFWLPLEPSCVFDTHDYITRFECLKKQPKVSLQELEEKSPAEFGQALVDVHNRLAQAIGAN